MNVTYDSAVIYEFAGRLIKQANDMGRNYALVGAILGLAMGAGAGGASGTAVVMAPLFGAVLGFVGYVIGRSRGFALRLQAMTALCQVRIEENTRRGENCPNSQA